MDTMDTDLIELVSLLKKNNQNITNGNTKLSLTAYLLHKINLALQESEYTQIVTSQSSVQDENLKFLSDTLRKVPKIVITQKVKSEQWKVDVSRFEKLQYIELHNIPISVLEGITSLRHQLRVLICVNVSDSIFEILGSSDLWQELHTAKLCCNGFEFLTQTNNTPWLQYLDLSFNKLKGKLILQSIKHLKYLNLSFNCLDTLPVFGDDVNNSLKVIILKNNFIQDLSTIHMFSVLEELDVSYNILVDHMTLRSVGLLPHLRMMNLSNNPIAYHPFHRAYTCRFLNKSVILNTFLLDGIQLNFKEQSEISRCHYLLNNAIISHQGSLQSDIFNRSVVQAIPSGGVSDADFGKCTVDINTNQTLVLTKTNEPIFKAKCDKPELIAKSIRENPLITGDSFSREPSPMHREKQFNGERPVLPDKCCNNLSTFSKVPEVIVDYQPIINKPLYSIVSLNHTDNISTNNFFGDDVQLQLLYLEYGNKLYEDLLAVGINPELLSSNFEKKNQLENSEIAQKDPAFHTSGGTNSECSDDDSISSDDDDTHDDELWVAQKELQDGSFYDILIAMDKCSFREKSIVNGRTLITWSLRSVISCESLRDNPFAIRLLFNRIHKDCRERTYIMEKNDAMELLKVLQKMLEARPVRYLNQNIYRCLNCNSIFSQDLPKKVLSAAPDYYSSDSLHYKLELNVKCFMCGSALVIKEEDDSCARYCADNAKLCSYSSHCSDKSRKSDSFIQDNFVLESTASRRNTLNIELTSSCTEHDSDIEIISNPSQDSIDVDVLHDK